MRGSYRAMRNAVAVVVLFALGSCGNSGSASRQRSAKAAPATIASHMDIQGGPDWLASDDRWLYVKLDAAGVERVDPKTARVVGHTDIGGSVCQGLGAGFGSVWACKDTGVVRIDPATDRVVATIPVAKAGEQGHLVSGFGRVWVLLDDNRRLVGIDPATNLPGPPIELPVRATELAIDKHDVWAVSAVDHTLLRIDPGSRSVSGRIDGLGELVAIADDGSNVFVATPDRVVQIDAASMTQLARIDTGPGELSGIGASNGDVWIRRMGILLRWRAGAAAPISVPFEPPVTSVGDVLVAFGSTWSSCNDDDVVVRVDAS